MGIGVEFTRTVAQLGSVRCLTRLFPKVRRAVLDAVGTALPSEAEELMRPHVERLLGPLFRRVGLPFRPRLSLLTFAVLHRTWEAQRAYLETVAGELDQAERGRRTRKR